MCNFYDQVHGIHNQTVQAIDQNISLHITGLPNNCQQMMMLKYNIASKWYKNNSSTKIGKTVKS